MDDATAAWQRVLERYVDEQGLVDFDALGEDRADLDRYLAWVGETSPWREPERFPTLPDRLAYALNSYNALAMAGVLDTGLRTLDGFFTRQRFFRGREVTVGGRRMSLHSYENDLIRPLGDPRVHFALNCMSLGCPRLPREAFTAEEIEQQLAVAAREFFASDRQLIVDHSRRRVSMSSILKWFRRDFAPGGRSASLIAYANRHLEQPIPTDYRVVFLPYDWAIIAR